MITIRFNGGVGNQLFQWAFLEFARLRGADVLMDTSVYEKKAIHGGFLLPKFIDMNAKEADETRYDESMLTKADRLSNKLFRKHKNHYHEEYFENIRDISTFLNKVEDKKKDVYLEGWWQDIRIPNSIKEILFRRVKNLDEIPELSAEQKVLLSQIRKTNSVSVHVRRGDYTSNPSALKHYGNICTEKYYEGALKYMNAAEKEPVFFVFSDDIEYCKTLFKDIPNVVMMPSSAPEIAFIDILLMAECKHHITANSSFSWWGAFLSRRNGTLIMPSVWDNTLPANKLKIPGCVCFNASGNREGRAV